MRRHHPGTGAAVLAVLLAIVGLGWLAAPPAWSHVSLVSATPADGVRLDEVPPSVTLKFSGELEPTAEVTVTGPDGAPLQVGTTIVSVDSLIQRLTDQSDAEGLFTLRYTARSVDGHAITGEQGFYVGGPEVGGTAASEMPAEAQGPPGLVPRAAKDDSGAPVLLWVALAALVVVLAGAAYWVGSRRTTRAVPAAPVPPAARAKAKRAQKVASRSQNRR